jgi:hypothetical protein
MITVLIDFVILYIVLGVAWILFYIWVLEGDDIKSLKISFLNLVLWPRYAVKSIHETSIR